MKTVATLLFAVSSSLVLSATAVAGPFNDRSPDYTADVQASSNGARPEVGVNATAMGFNDRSVEYIISTPASPESKRLGVYLSAIIGFNDRSS